MSYIINQDQQLIANVGDMPSGKTVQYAFHTTPNALDANREFDLVNPRHGKISNAKRWAGKEAVGHAKEINKDEFLIETDDQ